MALRRWQRFFASFDHVDAAIEFVNPALSRDEFRRARDRIVELVRDVADDDEAEEMCVLLDGVMAESLVTLRSVPADVVPRILASSADLAKAVGALRNHESERVGGLAGDVIRVWKASVADNIVRVSAAMEKLDALLQPLAPEQTAHHFSAGHSNNQAKVQGSQPYPRKTAPVAAVPCRVKAAEILHPLPKISESLPKNTPAVVGRAAGNGVVRCCSPEERMEATKRRLREGYREVEDAKRPRKIQVIEAPKMVEQRQRNMHPIMRERSQARCASSTAVRRSLLSSFQKIQSSVRV